MTDIVGRGTTLDNVQTPEKIDGRSARGRKGFEFKRVWTPKFLNSRMFRRSSREARTDWQRINSKSLRME